MTEFGSITGNQALKEAIVQRIDAEGGIPFSAFMEMALYHPKMGYYCSSGPKIGRDGDYLTSPEVSPIFGAIVGRQLREMWEAMGRPSSFDIVEAGAGNGTLCRDVLCWAGAVGSELFEATRYTIVEPIPVLEARQRRAIGMESVDAKVCWRAEMPDAVEGCIVSNELVDSMSVHRVAMRGGALREVFVGWDGHAFLEELRETSTPEIDRYFDRLGFTPGDGCRTEVNLEALCWMRRAGRALGRGFVLSFDYGYEAPELYAPWRKDGTLLCFYRHNPSNDPYARIGRQDMTSHVDFTSLRQAGEEVGLKTLGFVSQSEFLANLGILEALPPSDGEIALEERLARRRAVTELIDPAGLGRIKVLAQAKGVENARLRGFGDTGDA